MLRQRNNSAVIEIDLCKEKNNIKEVQLKSHRLYSIKSNIKTVNKQKIQ